MKRLALAVLVACLPVSAEMAIAANPDHIRQLILVNSCPGCDLSDVDFSGQTFINANLAGANLSGSNLSQADLSLSNLKGANLKGANLTSAYLYGVNLNHADLTDSTFVQTTLRGSHIEGTNFCVTRTFAGADFTGAKAGIGTLSDPQKSRFQRYFAQVKRSLIGYFSPKQFEEGDICVEMLQAFANPRLQLSAESQLRRLPDIWKKVTRLRDIEFELISLGPNTAAAATLRKERATLAEQLKESVALYCLGQTPQSENSEDAGTLEEKPTEEETAPVLEELVPDTEQTIEPSKPTRS